MLESCNDASVLRPSNKAIIFAIRGLESWQDPPTRHSKVLEEFLKGQSVLVGSSIDINEPSNSKEFSKLISSSLRQSSKATTDPSGTWQDSQESLAANIALLNGRRKPLQTIVILVSFRLLHKNQRQVAIVARSLSGEGLSGEEPSLT